MPILHEYKDGRGYYIKARYGGSITTYQVTQNGKRELMQSGYFDGSSLTPQEVQVLLDRGLIYTGGSGPGAIDDEQSVVLTNHDDPKDSQEKKDYSVKQTQYYSARNKRHHRSARKTQHHPSQKRGAERKDSQNQSHKESLTATVNEKRSVANTNHSSSQQYAENVKSPDAAQPLVASPPATVKETHPLRYRNLNQGSHQSPSRISAITADEVFGFLALLMLLVLVIGLLFLILKGI